MKRVGACKDRMADAIARFGRVPVVKRTTRVPSEHPALRSPTEAPFWSAGGLIHDGHGRVILVRHTPDKPWGDAWVTPGGRLEEGETVLEGLAREVREETGLDVVDPILTRIVQENLTDGRDVGHGYFAQFVARAKGSAPHPGPDVREARWFDALPPDLAYRDEYATDFRRLRRSFEESSL